VPRSETEFVIEAKNKHETLNIQTTSSNKKNNKKLFFLKTSKQIQIKNLKFKMSGAQPTITVEHIHHKASQTSQSSRSPTSRRRNSASPPSLRAPVASQSGRRLSAVVCYDAVINLFEKYI
jgi:hypothetical protein